MVKINAQGWFAAPLIFDQLTLLENKSKSSHVVTYMANRRRSLIKSLQSIVDMARLEASLLHHLGLTLSIITPPLVM